MSEAALFRTSMIPNGWFSTKVYLGSMNPTRMTANGKQFEKNCEDIYVVNHKKKKAHLRIKLFCIQLRLKILSRAIIKLSWA